MSGQDWVIIEFDGVQHVMPENEVMDHHPGNCKCMPSDDEGAMVHKSFDGREAFESGQRKPS